MTIPPFTCSSTLYVLAIQIVACNVPLRCSVNLTPHVQIYNATFVCPTTTIDVFTSSDTSSSSRGLWYPPCLYDLHNITTTASWCTPPDTAESVRPSDWYGKTTTIHVVIDQPVVMLSSLPHSIVVVSAGMGTVTARCLPCCRSRG